MSVLKEVPVGTVMKCPEKGIGDLQFVFGHSNVGSTKDDYPPTLLVLDMYGSFAPNNDYLTGTYAITVEDWIDDFDRYILQRNGLQLVSGSIPTAGKIYQILDIGDEVFHNYAMYARNIRQSSKEGRPPLTGGSISGRTLKDIVHHNMLGAVGEFPDLAPQAHTVFLLREALMCESISIDMRLRCIYPTTDRINSISEYAKHLTDALSVLVSKFGSESKDLRNLLDYTRTHVFKPNVLWEHHTSKQKYHILGVTRNFSDITSPIVVYANAENHAVYTRKVSDWDRSMKRIFNPNV